MHTHVNHRLVFAASRSIAALFAVALIAAVIAGPAVAQPSATVKLRVETADGTLFSGDVTTSGRSLPVASDNNSCAAGGPAVTSSDATPLTAAADAADAMSQAFETSFGGQFLCRWGTYVGGAGGQYWLMKVDNLTQNPPGTFLSGSAALHDGDEVLWYFMPPSVTASLDLGLPAVVTVGQTVTGSVARYDNMTDAKANAAGATVTGSGLTATAGADGKFNLTFAHTGNYTLVANLPNAVRDEQAVTVVAPGTVVPLAQLNAKRLCSKYRKTWRKRNHTYKRRYRRCLTRVAIRNVHRADLNQFRAATT